MYINDIKYLKKPLFAASRNSHANGTISQDVSVISFTTYHNKSAQHSRTQNGAMYLDNCFLRGPESASEFAYVSALRLLKLTELDNASTPPLTRLLDPCPLLLAASVESTSINPPSAMQKTAEETSSTAFFHSSDALDATPHHRRVSITRIKPCSPGLHMSVQLMRYVGAFIPGLPSWTRDGGCNAVHHFHHFTPKSPNTMSWSAHLRDTRIQS